MIGHCSTSNIKQQYDVVIAGGGMVGVSLALQLSAGNDLSILVVENFAIDLEKPLIYSPSFDARSTALSYGSRLILESMGVWSQLEQHLAAIETVHVSHRGKLGSTRMDCHEAGWPALGYVVENSWLGNVLLQAMKAKTNITFLSPASVKRVEPQQRGAKLLIESEGQQEDISTQLVVIADGADSGLRKQLGIDVEETPYHQQALIANVSFSQSHQGVAYERFTDQGPVALLPLTDSEQGQYRAALVWSLSENESAQLLDCEELDFLAELQQRFGYRLGEFVRVGQRFSYPLKLVESKEQVRTGIVVMGNAAHSLHPVAGQGFNLSLRDCARLTEVLLAAQREGEVLDSLALLESYYQQQHFDQQKTVWFSDRLPKVFGQKQWPLSTLRMLGLSSLDVLPATKQRFIQHMAGMHDGVAVG